MWAKAMLQPSTCADEAGLPCSLPEAACSVSYPRSRENSECLNAGTFAHRKMFSALQLASSLAWLLPSKSWSSLGSQIQLSRDSSLHLIESNPLGGGLCEGCTQQLAWHFQGHLSQRSLQGQEAIRKHLLSHQMCR